MGSSRAFGVAGLGGGCGAEELAAQVDGVDADVGELVVEAGFQAHGVVAEDDGVGVELERDRGVAEFADAVVWGRGVG